MGPGPGSQCPRAHRGQSAASFITTAANGSTPHAGVAVVRGQPPQRRTRPNGDRRYAGLLLLTASPWGALLDDVMRIRRVTVEKLFGIFDHDIELNVADHITILSGPNGFGKTILLRMILNFFRGRYGIFRRVPFTVFQVTFEQGQFLRLERREDSRQETGGSQKPSIYLKITSSRDNKSFEPPSPSRSGRTIRSVIADLKMELALAAKSRSSKDSQPGSELEAPDWLREWLDAVNVSMIETKRLDIADEDPHSGLPVQRRPAVLRYSEHLAGRIQRVLARYAARSQELDRTFPTRLLQQATPPLESNELRNKLAKLEERRAHLTRLGFLAPEQQHTVPLPEAVEQKRDVLSVYVADAEEKLAVFDKMAAKVELLTRIVNELFLYKRMSVDPETGFVFTSATGHRIAADNLSSGEQHQIVVLYKLIFLAPGGALVLLDEPELSLHAAWQERFLDDLKEMVALSGFDVLAATHSAEIVGAHWDLVVELKGPELPAHPRSAEQVA